MVSSPSAKVSENMDADNQLQVIVQELQLVVQQSGAMNNQIREVAETLELLATQSEDGSVYRQSGGVLVKISDMESLSEELEEGKSRLEAHVKLLNEREAELREQYEELISDFEGSK